MGDGGPRPNKACLSRASRNADVPAARSASRSCLTSSAPTALVGEEAAAEKHSRPSTGHLLEGLHERRSPFRLTSSAAPGCGSTIRETLNKAVAFPAEAGPQKLGAAVRIVTASVSLLVSTRRIGLPSRRSGRLKGLLGDDQVGQREQGVELGGVLVQAAVAHLLVTKQIFDDMERMLDRSA
jgi:hypothetical protein